MPKLENKLGRIGENIACKFLDKNNYKILKRNYHTLYGEIDIIATDDSFIIFTEVKLRKFNSKISGLEAVDIKKQEKILKTAMIYLEENNIKLQPRFDVIELTYYLKNNSKVLKEVNHIKNAFYQEGDYNCETF